MNTTIEILMPKQVLTKHTIGIIENVIIGASGLVRASATSITRKPLAETNDIIIECEFIGIEETDRDLLSALNVDNMSLTGLCLLYDLGLRAKAAGAVMDIDDLPIDDFLKQMT